MFLLAPLPSWKNLFSLFSLKKIDINSLSKVWANPSDVSMWFSKSAWSFLAIAVWKQIKSNQKEITFWLPDYFCNSSLFLLRTKDIRFVFYPIQENREPDYTVCKELAKNNTMDVFVLVHYFGKPSDANRAFEFCRSRNAVLIEDAAHVLKPIKGVGEKGDFILYSPHKHLPIPDGAVMVVRNSGPFQITWDQNEESRIKKTLTEYFKRNRNSRFFLCKWILKRFLQKLGFRNRKPSQNNFLYDTSAEIVMYPFFSSVARKMLSELVPRIGEIAKKKIRIQMIWDEILSNRYQFRNDRKSDKTWVPYLSEYSLDSIEAANSMFRTLSVDKFPISTWPDLPPEILENPVKHRIAIQLRRSCFFLTVHQSLSESKISRILSFKKSNLPSKIEVQELDSNSWDHELNLIEHVNLLQSWHYGEAKRINEAWNPKRILLKFEEKKIALVQILSKRYFFFFQIFRINRGPLFYPNITVEEERAVLVFLSKYASLNRGSVLFFNPEMNLNGRDLISIYENGFVRRNQISWSSSYIDLSLSKEELRKNLDGKWRNMLNAAEKNELGLEISNSDKNFQWMLEKYSELMVKKDFAGISVSFLKTLRECFPEKEKPLLLIATRNGQKVACICLTLSNRTGMYLVGWNGEEGRKLKANQFLLWNVISELKDRGYRWFDLGGIDEENTPTVAEFKLGINGERYELAGEFWKI
ncbi:lipid II:glycine glycyltransferase FemX [Leptospira alstonii]|nr:peptidoglycan bridge formation glycyltransferase FemA/FemB family protein [Leptospira alstonii]